MSVDLNFVGGGLLDIGDLVLQNGCGLVSVSDSVLVRFLYSNRPSIILISSVSNQFKEIVSLQLSVGWYPF
jgi:hypothetical protein